MKSSSTSCGGEFAVMCDGEDMILLSLKHQDTCPDKRMIFWEFCIVVPIDTWGKLDNINGIPERVGPDSYYYYCLEWYSNEAIFYIDTDWITKDRKTK